MLLFRSGVGARRMRKHRLDDFETRYINGRVHMQEDGGVAEELLDAEVEHDAVATGELHSVLANLDDFLRGEDFNHVAKLIGIRGTVVDRTRRFPQKSAHGA